MAFRSGEQDPVQPVQIVTGVNRPRSEDLQRRMTQYLVSMSIRTLCVIAAVVIDHPVRWVFVAGAVFLPYIAVVRANVRSNPRAQAMAPVDHRALTGSPVPPPRAGEE